MRSGSRRLELTPTGEPFRSCTPTRMPAWPTASTPLAPRRRRRARSSGMGVSDRLPERPVAACAASAPCAGFGVDPGSRGGGTISWIAARSSAARTGLVRKSATPRAMASPWIAESVDRGIAGRSRHDQHRHGAGLQVADPRHQIEAFATLELDLHQHEVGATLLDEAHRLLGIRRVQEFVPLPPEADRDPAGEFGLIIDVKEDRGRHRVSSVSRRRWTVPPVFGAERSRRSGGHRSTGRWPGRAHRTRPRTRLRARRRRAP